MTNKLRLRTYLSSPIPDHKGIRAFALLFALLRGAIGLAATWSPLANSAPSSTGTMLLLTDGTVMIQAGDSQNWLRLTPDSSGSYINGIWTANPINPMSTPRLNFASAVLPNGKVWLMGGEYVGPGLPLGWSGTGELYDPLTNTWSAIAPYPSEPSCPEITEFGGNLTRDSSVITGLLSTAQLRSGWFVIGAGIPAGATIISVDSANQLRISANATATGGSALTFRVPTTGRTTSNSDIVAGLESTNGLIAGFGVSGPGIPAYTTVTSIDSSSQIHISSNATTTSTSPVALTVSVRITPVSCFGDNPAIMLPGGKILAGSIFFATTQLYDIASNTWSPSGDKIYDQSNEEGWAMLSDGTVVVYDLYSTIANDVGHAEKYNPISRTWSSITPGESSATGAIPVLSNSEIGYEMGPLLRLQDGRIFVIGANGHTAFYEPSSNIWSVGPDISGIINGSPFLFAADDTPAAILPNGHVILAADAGLGLTSSGNTTAGSNVVTGIPSTAQFSVGWQVAGTGLSGSITSVDSSSQVHISQNAISTNAGTSIKFGGVFSNPTQLFDFDPVARTIVPLSPPPPDPRLAAIPAYATRMLMLPNGQLLFSDSSSQLWVYTPDGAAPIGLRPSVTQVVANSDGSFTLTGTQINGQSVGAAYSDGAEMDENYPIIRLVNGAGTTYYARTTNWSYVGVAGGVTPQTVNFRLSPSVPSGAYSLIVSGAGISSAPFAFSFGSALSADSVTPSSGSSASGTFVFVFSDTQSASNLTAMAMLFGSSTAAQDTCYIVYDRNAGSLALLWDSGVGSDARPIGSSSVLQNSQCSVGAANSQISGTSLSITVNVTFKSVFAGIKNVYLFGAEAKLQTGWIKRGTWTVTSSDPLPSADSVTPSAGSGASGTFVFTFSDTLSASNLTAMAMLFGSTTAAQNTCYIVYDRNAGSLALLWDSGVGSDARPIGSSSVLQNSQCSVGAASVQVSGNSQIITLNVTFKSGFIGSKNVYLFGAEAHIQTGWIKRGTFAVAGGGGPMVGAALPAAGSGSIQQFSFTFSDQGGASNLKGLAMLFASTLSASNACSIVYDRNANVLSLAYDNPSSGANSIAPGSNTVISNSQCLLSGANSTVIVSANSVVINVDLAFKSTWLGDKNIYGFASETGVNSGWITVGNWSVPGATPSADQVTPTSGSGNWPTFLITVSDAGGQANISGVAFLITNGSSTNQATSCYVIYDRAGSRVQLYNDSATAITASKTIGSSDNLQNSQCAIGYTSMDASGTSLTLTLGLLLKPAFSGPKTVYIKALEPSADSGWVSKSTWAVP